MKLIKGKEVSIVAIKDMACLNKKCFYSCFSWTDFGVVYKDCIYEFECPYCGSKIQYDTTKETTVGFEEKNLHSGPIW